MHVPGVAPRHQPYLVPIRSPTIRPPSVRTPTSCSPAVRSPAVLEKQEILECSPSDGTRTGFALRVFRKLFKSEEMSGFNCAGVQGKQKLNEEMLFYVRHVVLQKMGLSNAGETAQTIWRECVKAIDGACRRVTQRNNVRPDRKLKP